MILIELICVLEGLIVLTEEDGFGICMVLPFVARCKQDEAKHETHITYIMQYHTPAPCNRSPLVAFGDLKVSAGIDIIYIYILTHTANLGLLNLDLLHGKKSTGQLEDGIRTNLT